MEFYRLRCRLLLLATTAYGRKRIVKIDNFRRIERPIYARKQTLG